MDCLTVSANMLMRLPCYYKNLAGIERINLLSDYSFILDNATLALDVLDAPLMIDDSLADGPISISFDNVTEGRVNYIGSAYGDHIYTRGSNDPNTIDQFTLGAGSDQVQVASLHRSNTIANIAGIDEVSNFNVAGNDMIVLSILRNTLHEISVATADQADFVSQINTALGDAGITTETAAAGDIYRVEIAAGGMSGTYVISDKTGDLVTDDDEVLQLTGEIGEITLDQFTCARGFY